jgi:predicted RNase H-like nuclease
MTSMDTVLGIDACRTGWVGIAWSGTTVTPHHAPAIAALTEAAGPLSVIAIDIPIGLPDRTPRQADQLAREVVHARWSSVFTTPVRATLAVPTHPEASDVNRAHTGQGLSRQAFSLLPRIREVDDWLPEVPCRVVEVHPEVSFAELAGEALPSKKTWAGAERRRVLLAKSGIALPAELGKAGEAAVDDVLDAAVAAWTARRVHAGTARSLPSPPERFSDGIEAAIWY